MLRLIVITLTFIFALSVQSLAQIKISSMNYGFKNVSVGPLSPHQDYQLHVHRSGNHVFNVAVSGSVNGVGYYGMGLRGIAEGLYHN